MVPKNINNALMQQSIGKGYRHIFLIRKNPKDRLLSLNYSLMTGVWHDKQANTTDIDPNIFKCPIPIDQRLKHEIRCRKEAHRIYSNLKAQGCDPELVYFEDLYGNDHSKSKRIIENISSSLYLPKNLLANREFCKKLFGHRQRAQKDYTRFPEIDKFLAKISTLPDFDITSTEYNN